MCTHVARVEHSTRTEEEVSGGDELAPAHYQIFKSEPHDLSWLNIVRKHDSVVRVYGLCSVHVCGDGCCGGDCSSKCIKLRSTKQ